MLVEALKQNTDIYIYIYITTTITIAIHIAIPIPIAIAVLRQFFRLLRFFLIGMECFLVLLSFINIAIDYY